jgi:N-acetyl-anhydromuramyl-L-alanine amidase AmpD
MSKGTKGSETKRRKPVEKIQGEARTVQFHLEAGSGHAPKPPVTWIASPNFASRQNAQIDTLVLHNTDGTLNSAINRFKDPASQVSAHYLVDRDGSITQMVSDSDTAWHSGNKEVNQKSIGIEVVAWSSAAGTTAQQEISLVNLCKYIVDTYSVNLTQVLPHRAIKATDCPGWVWPSDPEFVMWKNTKLAQ